MKTTQDLKNEIILELLFKNEIQIGELIDYEKFKSIYQDYSYLPEYYFASILGMSYKTFYGIKSGDKFRVLKELDDDVYDKIVEYMNENNIGHSGSKITYDEFFNLLSKVPFLNERSLTKILGIPSSNFDMLKYRKIAKTKTHVRTHTCDITNEEREIINKLIASGLIYPGKGITFDEFEEIQKMVPEMDKMRLIQVLQINYNSLMLSAKENYKVTVLNGEVEDFVKKQREFIINDLITNRSARLKEKIDYDRFCELYRGYEYIRKIVFAELILGISYYQYSTLVGGGNAVILKSRIALTDEMRIYYFNHIIDEFNIDEGAIIDYEFFKDICKTYKDVLTEDDISNILGINKSMMYEFKCNKSRARILNGINAEKMKFIKKYLLEARFYQKEELDKIVSEYNLTIDDFIFYIQSCGQGGFKSGRKTMQRTIGDYLESLEKNKGLFIGKTYMDSEFYTRQYCKIKNTLKYIVYGKGVKIDVLEDIVQDLMIYVYENCGDLYYNFGDSDIFYRKLYSRVKKLLIQYLREKKYLVGNFNGDNMASYNDEIRSKRYLEEFNNNIEDEIIDEVDDGQPGELYKNLNLYNAC